MANMLQLSHDVIDTDANNILDAKEKSRLQEIARGLQQVHHLDGFQAGVDQRISSHPFLVSKITQLSATSPSEDIALAQFYLVTKGLLSGINEIDGIYGKRTQLAQQRFGQYTAGELDVKTLNDIKITASLAKDKTPSSPSQTTSLLSKNKTLESKTSSPYSALDEYPGITKRSDFAREAVLYNPYIEGFASVENHGKIDMSKHTNHGSAMGPYGFLYSGHLKEMRSQTEDLRGISLKEQYPDYKKFFSSLKKTPSLALKICIIYEKWLLQLTRNKKTNKQDIKRAAAFNLAGYAGMRNIYKNPRFSLGKNMSIGYYANQVVENSQPSVATKSGTISNLGSV